MEHTAYINRAFCNLNFSPDKIIAPGFQVKHLFYYLGFYQISPTKFGL